MSFITIQEDKFKGVKYYRLNNEFSLKADGNMALTGFTTIDMSLEYVDFPKEDKHIASSVNSNEITNTENDYAIEPVHSVIRFIIKLQDKDWWFLNTGSLIFLADGEKINLGRPKSRQSGTTRLNQTTLKGDKEIVGIYENTVYFISTNDFLKLCKSKELHLQINGKQWKHEVELNDVVKNYLKVFYKEVFDANEFDESVDFLIDDLFIQKQRSKKYMVIATLWLLINIIWWNIVDNPELSAGMLLMIMASWGFFFWLIYHISKYFRVSKQIKKSKARFNK